jgi:hypothetical protein
MLTEIKAVTQSLTSWIIYVGIKTYTRDKKKKDGLQMEIVLRDVTSSQFIYSSTGVAHQFYFTLPFSDHVLPWSLPGI